MKGLILKDFINLKKNNKIFAGLTVLYWIMALMSEDTNFFSSVLIVLVALLTLSLYSYDDLAKWDSYALTMPISRDNIVQGKYLMMLLLTVLGVVYSSVFTILVNIYQKKEGLFLGSGSSLIGAAVVIIFYSITIPFITKLGVEKARLIFFAVYLIPFVAIIGFNKLSRQGNLVISGNLVQIGRIFFEYIYIILPVITLSFLIISYIISMKIYRKKEF
jgi:hypothetical protein